MYDMCITSGVIHYLHQVDCIYNREMNKKVIISRILFWTIWSVALAYAIQDGWWLWVVLAFPILFYIFYKDDLPKFKK
ncbi:MAG: hypothetical protein CL764_01845 [Chloroflexi bacterium]|nr:hypothetical protein [Chloroflexota bacterium]|tara:strand:+ start:3418 stop:3651 length:234 start_codon:yes stop_codon:yes gene_type:complete